MKKGFLFCFVAIALLGSPLLPQTGRRNPRLLVFIVVDQFRYDYLTRLQGRFSGGFKRLLKEAVRFSHAKHAHAVTTTGPGHASLATGVWPSRSGIIDNAWYDRSRGKEVNCVEDADSPMLEADGPGRSPRNLLRGTLGDWIKKANPASRVFGASRKDRGAILCAGKHADAAFWYDAGTGNFVTSRYYLPAYPDWIRRFNDLRYPDSFFGKQWTALAGAEPNREPDSGFGETDEGLFPRRLPKTLGNGTLRPDDNFRSDFGSTPFMDDYLERFAEALIENEGLGIDENLDFLSLSFSALDSVGHEYGPNSLQAKDAILRLDRTLDRLFGFLDSKVGLDRVVVSLSADHGVMGVPEYEASRGGTARRFNEGDRLCIQQAGVGLRDAWGDDKWILDGLYLNYETLGSRNRRRSDLEAEIARRLQKCEAVERVWTRTELESTATGERLDQFRRSFNAERSADLMVQLKEFVISYRGHGTTHGSPYDYDTHVPMLIWLPGQPGREVSDPVWTVDMAPTLAGLLGIAAPSDLDGADRSVAKGGHLAGLR